MASLLLLTGCPQPGTVKTAILSPASPPWSGISAINFTTHDADNTNIWCDFAWGNGATGEPVLDLRSGETLSGHTDYYEGGSGPFACETRHEWLHRGHFAFDVSNFKVIYSATLKFDVAYSEIDFVLQTPPTCHATVLGMATGNDLWDFDELEVVPVV